MIPFLLAAIIVAVADTTPEQAALQQALAAPAHPAMRWGDIRDVRAALDSMYAHRQWRLLWSTDGTATPAARQLIGQLDSAATRGLDPGDFDVTTLHAWADASGRVDVAATAGFDVTLSVAAGRYLLALARGRVDPRVLHPTLPRSPPRLDVATTLERLAATDRPDTVLREIEPQHLTYQRLLALLARYRALGPGTGALDSRDSAAIRVRQLELALERWRWLPRSIDGRWILVNVPAFRLYAFSGVAGAEDLVRMNVVVGQAVAHSTPLLATRVVAVQFHPPWLVPTGIARREILPEALRDARYLAQHHYDLLRGDSVVAATDSNVAGIGTTIGVRQEPGPWNALGQVKFVTPNGADIYLHDTPERVDFLRNQRDVSHGCIRVADPLTLTGFIFQQQPGWTPERVAALWQVDSTFSVPLARPIPVFVVYQTVVPDRSGGLMVYPDLYGLDRQLDELLRAGYPYPAAPP